MIRPVDIDFTTLESNRDAYNRSAQGLQRPKFVTLQPLHKNLLKKGFDFDSESSPVSPKKVRDKLQQLEETQQQWQKKKKVGATW